MGGVGFWLVVAILALAWTCIVLMALEAIGNAADTRDRLDREALAQQAADHGEPSREEVEADWWPTCEPTDTPLYDQTKRSRGLLFAASVLADIDDLPDGVA